MPEDIDATDDPQPEQDNAVIRNLRAQADEGKAARAEADAARRELAFVKAGIDPDDPQQGYFVRGYQGDITADAIKTAATDAGFLGQAITTSEPQGMSDAERAAFSASAGAASAGMQPEPEVDPYKDLRGQNFRSGETPENFAMRVAAASQGAGNPVAYDGPFREYAGDTGIVPRAGTPLPKRQ